MYMTCLLSSGDMCAPYVWQTLDIEKNYMLASFDEKIFRAMLGECGVCQVHFRFKSYGFGLCLFISSSIPIRGQRSTRMQNDHTICVARSEQRKTDVAFLG